MGPLLERAHDLIRKADRLSGWCPSAALPVLRSSLRAMNSYYSTKLRGSTSCLWKLSRPCAVGRHAAPAAAVLSAFLSRWTGVYSGVRRGELQLVAMAAAHQRLTWIHPFADGNGRVVRLRSHLVLGYMGLTNGPDKWFVVAFARLCPLA